MKVLIFGANGQVGRALQSALPALGYEIVALSRNDRGGDLLNFEAVREVVERTAPRVIVNAAAFTQVDLAESQRETAWLVNAEAVSNLAQCAKGVGALLIHFGTDFVFDGTGMRAWKECDEERPLNVYGESKLAGERAITASGCRHVILRVSWVHAAGHRNFVTSFLNWARTKPTVSVVDDQWGTPTSATDIARAVGVVIDCAIDDASLDGVYHFANAGFTTRFECAKYIAALLPEGFSVDLKPVDSSAFDLPARRPLNCCLETEKFRQTFAFEARSWQDGVRETVLKSL